MRGAAVARLAHSPPIDPNAGVDGDGAVRLHVAMLRQACVDARQRSSPQLAAEAIDWIAVEGAALLEELGNDNLARLARAGTLHVGSGPPHPR